ncbi:MAG: hypothetical protein A2945_03255 [Candidatus Liptonbacteria bacterium RIFCSPLOWO2_01_FULL_52_25]|uniref:Uncharacterized protein n=1 Tax=Candidatus Liptonbacteria bacterium RIFCSPLOWO2_01_FULL_52_25 TaxID=1798650 RepID=A0A1G2CGV0_9BACT|nr:MAG: hypothetical protein A2945_03255 [Candidatus Liptonbacteria bacterium RIFCSPLOWO2_01_FULL_52_25]
MSEKESKSNAKLTEERRRELLEKLRDYGVHGGPDNPNPDNPDPETIIQELIDRGGFEDETKVKEAIDKLEQDIENLED